MKVHELIKFLNQFPSEHEVMIGDKGFNTPIDEEDFSYWSKTATLNTGKYEDSDPIVDMGTSSPYVLVRRPYN